MKRKKIYSLLMILGGLFTACNPDGVDSVDFDVMMENDTREVYVGDPVTFLLDGKPDYIIFYSGEYGNRYADRNRSEVDLASVSLSAKISQRCWTGALLRGQRLFAYISEDFNGIYTKEGLEEATWTEITGTEEGQLHYPTCATTWDDSATSTIDFSAYKDKPFYIAFQYVIPEDQNATGNQPRVLITPLTIDRVTAEGEKLQLNSPQREFAFQYVQKKGDLSPEKNGNSLPIDDTRLGFQPDKAVGVEMDIWAVSQKMDLRTVSPNTGIPVKTLNSKISSYTHTYSEAGEYTVTFVASNANMWNDRRVVKEMKVIVKEKSEI